MPFYLLAPFFAFFLVLFQQFVLSLLFFNQLSVEVSLLLAIYAGFRMDLMRGATLSLLMGFFIDCLTGALTGLYMFVYASVFFLSYALSARIYVKRTAMIVAYAVFCTLLEGWLLSRLMGMVKGVYPENIQRIFLFQALVLGALSPAFFSVFERFEAFFRIDEP